MKGGNSAKALITGVKWSSVGIFGRAIVQILQISILTRYLSIEDFGLVAIALFVINFTNIFVELGFTASILNKQNATDKEYSSLFWLNLIISVALYFCIVFSSSVISEFYSEPQLKSIIAILGINVIALTVGRVNRTILHKNFKFKKIAIIDIMSSLIGLLLSIMLAIYDYGIYSLIYGTLISSLVSSILYLIFKMNKIYFELDLFKIRPFFRVGGYSFLGSILSFFSTDIDILIIGKMLGPKSLGFYSLTKQIVMKVFAMINPVISTVLTPYLSSVQDDKNKVRLVFLKTLSYLSLINVPLYLLIIVLSQEVLIVFYGVEYVSARWLLSSLAFTYYMTSVNNIVGSLQIATGRTDLGFTWSMLSLIITPFVIYLACLVNIEMVGSARMLLSIFIIIPLWFVQIRPMVKISLQKYLVQFYRPVLFMFLILLLNYVLDIGLLYNVYVSSIIKASSTLIVVTLYFYTFSRHEASAILNQIKSLITK